MTISFIGSPRRGVISSNFLETFYGPASFFLLNMQPVYDLDLKSQKGNKKYFTVSKYVLNRLITGETHGLALKALGPIVATIKFSGKEAIKLYFNRIKQ